MDLPKESLQLEAFMHVGAVLCTWQLPCVLHVAILIINMKLECLAEMSYMADGVTFWNLSTCSKFVVQVDKFETSISDPNV